jgi:MoaA/NifB/PqqE/SkfB family radical SAM enzyme
MCALPYRKDNRSCDGHAFMSVQLFEEIVEQLQDLKRVHLQGLGEPMLNPQFFSMVGTAARKGLEVSTSSSLATFDGEMAHLCATSGLHHLHVSVDAAHASAYEAIRRGASFDRLLANLELLLKAKESAHSRFPLLHMTVVVMRRNLRELPHLVRMASRFGMKEIFVQHLCHSFEEENLPLYYAPMRRFVRNQSLLYESSEEVEESFGKAREIATHLGLALRLPNLAPRPERRPGLTGAPSCDWPWTGIYVSYQGLAMPCCMVSSPDRVNFGSLKSQRVYDLWDGEGYKAFRRQLLSTDPPEVCRFCALYSGTF